MRRDLQTFCPKDCRYNSGSFCLLPFDSPCPHCTYSSGTSLFGSTMRFIATPYGRCPVCGAEGPCDVVGGEPTLSATGTEYLFRCPKCREVSWVPAERYEYIIQNVTDDDNTAYDYEELMKIETKIGAKCIICDEEYEIVDSNDGHICPKCKAAIKRLRGIFDEVDKGASTTPGDTDGDAVCHCGRSAAEPDDERSEARCAACDLAFCPLDRFDTAPYEALALKREIDKHDGACPYCKHKQFDCGAPEFDRDYDYGDPTPCDCVDK